MNLSDLLTRLSNPAAEADGYVAHCPAHGDSQASLRIAVGKDGDKVIVKCRTGCSTKDVMRAIGLSIKDLATMTVDDAAAAHVKRATSTDAGADPSAIAALVAGLDTCAERILDKDDALGTAVRDYAMRRFAVTEDDIKRLGLGAWDDKGTARLVVPFYDKDGMPRGHQARALDPSEKVRWKGPKSPEGGSWAKIGYLEGSAGWSEVLITEGPGDGLTAAAIGYDAIIVRGASHAKSKQVLDDIAAMVGDRKAIVCPDGDRAGIEFGAAMVAGLADRGVTVASLAVPAGEDLSSWREREGARPIVRAVMDAPTEATFTSASRERDEDEYPLTDLGNGRFLRDYAKSKGSALRYSPEAGFFVLDDGVWRTDDLDQSRAFAQEAAESLAAIADRMWATAGDNGVAQAKAKAWRAHARYSQSSKGIDAALREVRALRDVATSLSQFDKRDDLLACLNGVVNLRTGELLPHDPAYLITRRIDLKYRPEATAPRWEKFLTEIFPTSPQMPSYMQRLVGYGITGLTVEQCFVVMVGKGANGKSVLTDTLTGVFREQTVTTSFSTFEQKPSGGIPNDIAALKGARLVMASEGEAGKPMAEAVLKRVTGRDLISARYMRKEFFEFRPNFLLWLASNSRPQFRGQDEGLWRRVKLIPFERYFAPHERDHRLGDNLLAEGEGILAWAVRGSMDWYKHGLGDPETVVAATQEYRETSNALDGFLPGEWVLDDSVHNLSGSDLYESYREWADREGLQQREVWTRRTFFAALEERGLTKHKRNVGVVFDGVRKVRSSDTFDAPEKNVDESCTAEAAPADLSVSNDNTPLLTVAGASLDDLD